MVQELPDDDNAVFFHVVKEKGKGLTEVTVSELIDDLISRAMEEYQVSPRPGNGFLDNFAKDVIRGWNEYLAQVRMHISLV